MVFKCKMCGGDIQIIEGSNVGKCLYCKSKMTLPNIENEKILNLYNRANNLRLSNEFDKAFAVYEMILELNEQEIEAHWGLILCKYGIEYVDDPKTKKKIITCHRTRYESVLTDLDYKYIIDKAYGEAKELYIKEANIISDIQKKALEISSREEPYDIFICYKETDDSGNRTKDSVLAEDIYNKLTELNYKVFFARKTLENKLGIEYEPYIFSALNSAKVMLVIGTNIDNFNSIWVKNEWSRYLDLIKKDRKKKTLIPVYKDMDAYELPEEFSMLQAQSMDKIGAIQDLTSGISKIIKANSTAFSDIDEEMYEKFKKMLADDKKREEERMNARYEVAIKSESVYPMYVCITFVLSALMAILMFISSITVFAYNDFFELNLYRLLNQNIGQSIIQAVVGLVTFIAFLAGFVSRYSNKWSKFMYLFNIVLETIYIILMYRLGYHLTIYYYLILLLNILLFVIKPKWKLTERITYASLEEKQEIEAENAKVSENYVEKDKNIVGIKGFVVFGISLLLVLIISLLPLKSIDNSRDSSLDQIEIITTSVNIRSKPGIYNSTLSRANIGMIFTYYDVVDENGNSVYNTSNKRVWYKVKIAGGMYGYIAGSHGDEKYVKVLEKDN